MNKVVKTSKQMGQRLSKSIPHTSNPTMNMKKKKADSIKKLNSGLDNEKIDLITLD